MSDNQRLEELRRRVARDPASIAFAHLAEEYRRSGRHDDAVETCRTGLEHHPAYLSARVTLARALMELARFEEAQAELDLVLQTAPENLTAIRTLSDIQRRRGDVPAAAGVFSPVTLAAARDQEELEQMIRRMTRTLDSAPASHAPAQPEPAVAVGAAAPQAHERHTTSFPENDVFTLFGAALNAEAGRFHDTAREEFFAGAAGKPPAPVPASRYPTLELKPAAAVDPFDDKLLANLAFRDAAADEPIGFAPATLDALTEATKKEAEEARQLLIVLERWLAALEAPGPISGQVSRA